jgi:hypothetical protein
MQIKSAEEIVEQLAEIIHRHRRRYVRKYTRPCPINCEFASESTKRGVTGCDQCGSTNPEQCRNEIKFVQIETKEEIVERFRQDIRDVNILRHEFRDVLTLLWCTNAITGDTVDEQVISMVEKRNPGGKQ